MGLLARGEIGSPVSVVWIRHAGAGARNDVRAGAAAREEPHARRTRAPSKPCLHTPVVWVHVIRHGNDVRVPGGATTPLRVQAGAEKRTVQVRRWQRALTS